MRNTWPALSYDLIGASETARFGLPEAGWPERAIRTPGQPVRTPNLWIERYRRPWQTAAADEVVDLFTPDASYRSSVFREPFLGRDAIRQYGQRALARSMRSVRMGRPIIGRRADDPVRRAVATGLVVPRPDQRHPPCYQVRADQASGELEAVDDETSTRVSGRSRSGVRAPARQLPTPAETARAGRDGPGRH
jgi:hypothetical protein